MTPAIEAMPDKEPRILAGRQEEHRLNMQRVIEGVKARAEAASSEQPKSDFPGLGVKPK